MKRDVAKLPGFWTLQAVGFGFFALSALIANVPSIGIVATLRASGSFIVWTFAASCLLRFACRDLLRRGFSWAGLELRALALCVPAGVICGYLAAFTATGRPPDLVGWIGRSVQVTFILFVWCSLYFSIKTWQQSTRERERLLLAEAELREARLSALRYQLNPHFLFNSLNAVSTLILDGKPSAATRMLAQIGDLLRTILDGQADLEVPLAAEIALIEQYLAIEQTRLGPRLRVDVSVSPDTLDALVPAMLLQPLVENAVRYGVAPFVDGGAVRVRSRVQDGRLQLTVSNTASVGEPQIAQRLSAGGVGLSNTAERLKTLYADDHTFQLEWPPSGGCEVRVALPLRRSQVAAEAPSCAS